MSVVDRIYNGLKGTIELNAKVEMTARRVDDLFAEVRDLKDRLIRLETIIEITRPDGSTLKLTPPA